MSQASYSVYPNNDEFEGTNPQHQKRMSSAGESASKKKYKMSDFGDLGHEAFDCSGNPIQKYFISATGEPFYFDKKNEQVWLPKPEEEEEEDEDADEEDGSDASGNDGEEGDDDDDDDDDDEDESKMKLRDNNKDKKRPAPVAAKEESKKKKAKKSQDSDDEEHDGKDTPKGKGKGKGKSKKAKTPASSGSKSGRGAPTKGKKNLKLAAGLASKIMDKKPNISKEQFYEKMDDRLDDINIAGDFDIVQMYEVIAEASAPSSQVGVLPQGLQDIATARPPLAEAAKKMSSEAISTRLAEIGTEKGGGILKNLFDEYNAAKKVITDERDLLKFYADKPDASSNNSARWLRDYIHDKNAEIVAKREAAFKARREESQMH